jgi:hypothetical protein
MNKKLICFTFSVFAFLSPAILAMQDEIPKNLQSEITGISDEQFQELIQDLKKNGEKISHQGLVQLLIKFKSFLGKNSGNIIQELKMPLLIQKTNINTNEEINTSAEVKNDFSTPIKPSLPKDIANVFEHKGFSWYTSPEKAGEEAKKVIYLMTMHNEIWTDHRIPKGERINFINILSKVLNKELKTYKNGNLEKKLKLTKIQLYKSLLKLEIDLLTLFHKYDTVVPNSVYAGQSKNNTTKRGGGHNSELKDLEKSKSNKVKWVKGALTAGYHVRASWLIRNIPLTVVVKEKEHKLLDIVEQLVADLTFVQMNGGSAKIGSKEATRLLCDYEKWEKRLETLKEKGYEKYREEKEKNIVKEKFRNNTINNTIIKPKKLNFNNFVGKTNDNKENLEDKKDSKYNSAPNKSGNTIKLPENTDEELDNNEDKKRKHEQEEVINAKKPKNKSAVDEKENN